MSESCNSCLAAFEYGEDVLAFRIILFTPHRYESSESCWYDENVLFEHWFCETCYSNYDWRDAEIPNLRSVPAKSSKANCCRNCGNEMVTWGIDDPFGEAGLHTQIFIDVDSDDEDEASFDANWYICKQCVKLIDFSKAKIPSTPS